MDDSLIWINNVVNAIDPYLGFIGFIISGFTLITTLKISNRVNNQMDRQTFHSECDQLIGFYRSLSDKLQSTDFHSVDIEHFKSSIVLQNTEIENKYSFLSTEVKKIISAINDFDFNTVTNSEDKLELSKKLISLSTLLAKENRQ